MMMPDYHTLHTQAQDRITRCQREAIHVSDDMRTLRQHLADLLHALANALEPRPQPYLEAHFEVRYE